MLLARSVPEGEADEIAMDPGIDTRRSAVGGKADVPATWPGSPLLAISGRCAPKAWNISGSYSGRGGTGMQKTVWTGALLRSWRPIKATWSAFFGKRVP